MLASGIPLQAYLVIDNSVLVLLNEFCCQRWAAQVGPSRLIADIVSWLEQKVSLLASLALDQCVHCTDQVVAEFLPGNGRLAQVRGVQRRDYTGLAQRVRQMLRADCVDEEPVRRLRMLPAAPRRLIGPYGLSDADLSLVALALQLARIGEPVYILSNDEDLLVFISWLRICSPARQQWPQVQFIQGLNALTYIESVHRSCRISTDEMKDLLSFAMQEHYARTELSGTQKGKVIMAALVSLAMSLTESAVIKSTQKALLS